MIPSEISSTRLCLRPWRRSDAPALLEVLEANVAHLEPWIPKHVSEPVPVSELATRLEGFAEAFDASREWRYAILLTDTNEILGEASLFARDAGGRVPFDRADRAEIGYWVRADWTGRGIATESTRLLLDLVAGIEQFRRVEIRCDDRNVPSAAIPRRLGFHLEQPDADGHTMVWYSDLRESR